MKQRSNRNEPCPKAFPVHAMVLGAVRRAVVARACPDTPFSQSHRKHKAGQGLRADHAHQEEVPRKANAGVL